MPPLSRQGCSDQASCGSTYFNSMSPLFHMPSTDEAAGNYCSGASCDTQYLARAIHEYGPALTIPLTLP